MQLKNQISYTLFIVLSLLLFNSSCTSEDPDAIAANDRKKILDFIKENGLSDVAIEHESGLFYIMEEEGEGLNPSLTSRMRMRYIGYYTDEEVFDFNDGALITLQSTILGWQVGIPLFKNGGKGTLFIPSAMGYGSYPPYGSGIRRNAVLIFEFEIIDIGS
jgi:FKBP-type peptidyl-prolyl cis-trans isomerase FkpA